MDILIERVLALRKEPDDRTKEYVREAWWREMSGLPQVKPQVWFSAPPGWEAEPEAAKTYDALSGDIDEAQEEEQPQPASLA